MGRVGRVRKTGLGLTCKIAKECYNYCKIYITSTADKSANYNSANGH